jgi:hypothetical protein
MASGTIGGHNPVETRRNPGKGRSVAAAQKWSICRDKAPEPSQRHFVRWLRLVARTARPQSRMKAADVKLNAVAVRALRDPPRERRGRGDLEVFDVDIDSSTRLAWTLSRGLQVLARRAQRPASPGVQDVRAACVDG